MIKVTDNFITQEQFTQLYDTLTSKMFPWYYDDHVDWIGDGKFQFIHAWYISNEWWSPKEPINPLLNKINPDVLVRVKANLLTPTVGVVKHNFHRDMPDNRITTGILYVTDGGYTEFESGEVIESKPNRYVEFPCYMKHRGVSVDKRRILINLNYFNFES